MAKKYGKKVDSKKNNLEKLILSDAAEQEGAFEEEVVEEVVTAEVEEEVVPEPEVAAPKPEPKPEPAKKNQNGSKLKVTSLSAWIFEEADVRSQGLKQASRGNQLELIEIVVGYDGEQWYHVNKPEVGGPVEGFIQFHRVQVI